MNNNVDRQTEFYAVDLVKFIMAICVIAIHTNPLVNFNNIYVINFYNFFLSLAVPFFFVTSAYLLFSKMNIPFSFSKNKDSIKRYILKILRLYIVWNIIYIPISIFWYIDSDKSLIFSIAHYIRGFFFIGEHFYSWILWYLLSTIYSMGFIYYLLKRKFAIINIFIIATIVFLIGMGFSYLVYNQEMFTGIVLLMSKFIKIVFGSGRLLTGMIYLALGILFATYINKFNFSIWISLICLIFLFVTSIYNYFGGFPFIKLITVFFLFHFAVNIKLKKRIVYKNLRLASTVMYFTHMIFFFLWSYCFGSFKGSNQYGLEAFIFTFLLSMCMFILVKYLKTKNFGVIKVLFN